MINNLTGTIWTWKDTFDTTIVLEDDAFYINFDSSEDTFNELQISAGPSLLDPSWYSFTVKYVGDETGVTEVLYEADGDGSVDFYVPSLRTFTITGGTDVTNSDLIAFLEANATLLYVPPLKTSFSKISYDAGNKILTIDDKYYQLASTATGSNITGTSFSNMSLDELGELIIDNTSIHLPIKTTQISFNNGGTYTCANGVTFTMSAFDYLDDHNPELANYQGYWFTNSLGRNMLIWVIEDSNQPEVWETAYNWLGDTDNVAQTWHTTYTSYADDMYIHIVEDDYDYMSVASQLGWSEADLLDRWQEVGEKFEGIDYVFLHFKRNRTTGYWEIQEES